MNFITLKIRLILLIVTLMLNINAIEYGFINKPVVDLIIKSNNSFDHDIYTSMLYSWKTRTDNIPRCLQLVLHEVVEIIRQPDNESNEISVRVPDAYYAPEENTFFMLKENITLITEKNKKFIPTKSFLKFKTLLFPFYDKKNNITFSAGTSFVFIPKKSTRHFFFIIFYNQKTKLFTEIKIPKNFFIPEIKDKHKKFIMILRSFIENSEGFIPYVWGGTSFLYRLNKKFILADKQDESFWTYPEDMHNPKCGFDCSGLIWRAARMAHIHFAERNTKMMNTLTPLSCTQSIQNGDLILFHKHVCIVSDIEKNLLIESSGYDSGKGKVYETALKNRFAGIETFQELKKKYDAKEPIVSLQTGNELSFTLIRISI